MKGLMNPNMVKRILRHQRKYEGGVMLKDPEQNCSRQVFPMPCLRCVCISQAVLLHGQGMYQLLPYCFYGSQVQLDFVVPTAEVLVLA